MYYWISKNKNNLVDYVLDKFSQEDIKKIDSILPKISCIIEDFAKYDINKLMEKYKSKKWIVFFVKIYLILI